MHLIVGLGNPGEKYTGTRHNVGFEVVDKLSESLRSGWKQGKGPYTIAVGRHKGQKVVLVKPETYMNRSGVAVSKAVNWYKVPLEACLVCYDDLDLPVGKLRLRPGGSAGSHNGMLDIINRLGSDEFPRLRIGIGNDFPRGRQSDYVLSRFTPGQRKQIDEVIDDSKEAALCFVREGIDAAMNKFN